MYIHDIRTWFRMILEFKPCSKIEALQWSIEKWNKIAFQDREDHGSKDCALCSLFNMIENKNYPEKDCVGCPVYEHTGERFCKGTPYDEWVDYIVYKLNKKGLKGLEGHELEKARRLAISEWMFLTTLLLEEEKRSEVQQLS